MKTMLGCYYFPNYHTDDARNTAFHGAGWSEWEVVKQAVPRFEGHDQPRIPTWGYTDEKDPAAMAQKIDAAADAGIDVFIFDWYYYDDGPFLNRGLEEGFFNAPNRSRMKFCTMWANHDWVDIHPAVLKNYPLLYGGLVTPETFRKICKLHIEDYFRRPEYFCLDGKPYFSIYELSKFVAIFGSVEGAKQALEQFRQDCVAAGLPGVHLNASVWGKPIVPGEETPSDPGDLARELGFDSTASYVWAHHSWQPGPTADYLPFRDGYLQFWNEFTANHPGLEYYPNATVGWDSTPRTRADQPWTGCDGYPFGCCMINNTPERFKQALKDIKTQLEESSQKTKFMTINSWNEWTEGSYLEPDNVNGTGFLDAVKEVFKG
ncbi:MAG: glycoside hydrolase family 99-like domain-containing protein [Lentisphaeria bacterium]|nr:glycoside hydrolase family 99-like domain-containing protein [Lentisphaeria bacterium]